MRDAVAAARGCSLGVVWMGPREAASEERAAMCALREGLAVVLPPLVGAALTRVAYMAVALRGSSYSSLVDPLPTAWSSPCGLG